MSPMIVCRIALASPSPASGVAPRWPTIAVSASRNSGSAMSAPSAGTARRRMSRSTARVATVLLMASRAYARPPTDAALAPSAYESGHPLARPRAERNSVAS